MQGYEDILGDTNPNLIFDLEELILEDPVEAGQAAGSAAHQKSVSAHRTHHRVRRGHEIPLISNLREHVWVLHRQEVSALIILTSIVLFMCLS